MDEAQRSSVKKHRYTLCRALQSSAEHFLIELDLNSMFHTTERQSIESQSQNGTDKILRCLDILQEKDGGYAFLISHLRHNNMSSLADELNSTVSCGHYLLDGTNQDIIKKLTADCVDFYLGNFRTAEGFDGDTEPIELVWIGLQLGGDFDNSSKKYENIFVRMAQNNCRVAVVKGQPGSGKTTLIKKIAYDWAKIKQNNLKKTKFLNFLSQLIRSTSATKFDLILAAPLRSIHLGSDPIEMAVGFLLEASGSVVNLPDVERISNLLKQSSLNILVILDGLDEYEHQSNSFLAKVFGSALTSTASRYTSAPIHLRYFLVVTSRPYACKTVNESLLTHKWEIAGFTEESQLEFVQLRCKTERGKVRAAQYLRNSSVVSEIGSIPLLLLLVCFLSDRDADIPAKLTKLYEMFIRQMLIRSAKRGATETFDPKTWRMFELVRILGGLALLGVVENKFEFSSDEREMCQVGNDSFDSGLLLFRSDSVSSATKADFPHRSIQEFLAALYCVDFWPADSTISSATGWPLERNSEMKVEMLVAKLIYPRDSQFCRFYFGLLSGQPEFEVKMRKLLEEYLDVGFVSPLFLGCLSNSLADCSDAECFLTGQIVNSLVDRSFNKVKSRRNDRDLRLGTLMSTRTKLRPQFESGLKLKWLGNSLNSFYLRSESQSELKMIQIWLEEENLAEKVGQLEGFEQVEWVMISQWASSDVEKLKFAFELIKRLPKCRNCVITDVSAGYFPIRLWMGRKSEFPVNSGHSGVNPEFVCFEVNRNFGEKILRKLSSLRQSDLAEVEIESIEEISEGDDEDEDEDEDTVTHVRLAVSGSSWSVWNFFGSEAEWS